MFDLETDPNELTSVIDDPSYAEARAFLEAELARLQGVYGDEPYRGPETPRQAWGDGEQKFS